MKQTLAALNRALRRRGEDIVLRRTFGTTPSTTFDVPVRAFVRGYKPEELVGGITITDALVITSPLYFEKAQWPGGELPSSPGVNPRWPRIGDRCVIAGRNRRVENVAPVVDGDETVRIELRVTG
jgi:hypothetical protein